MKQQGLLFRFGDLLGHRVLLRRRFEHDLPRVRQPVHVRAVTVHLEVVREPYVEVQLPAELVASVAPAHFRVCRAGDSVWVEDIFPVGWVQQVELFEGDNGVRHPPKDLGGRVLEAEVSLVAETFESHLLLADPYGLLAGRVVDDEALLDLFDVGGV